jgi:hypothetical protein
LKNKILMEATLCTWYWATPALWKARVYRLLANWSRFYWKRIPILLGTQSMVDCLFTWQSKMDGHAMTSCWQFFQKHWISRTPRRNCFPFRRQLVPRNNLVRLLLPVVSWMSRTSSSEPIRHMLVAWKSRK